MQAVTLMSGSPACVMAAKPAILHLHSANMADVLEEEEEEEEGVGLGCVCVWCG